MSLPRVVVALALSACALLPRQEEAMAGPIAVVECFSGTGPSADLPGGVTIALGAGGWRELEARLPDGHPARGRCEKVDFARSAVLFVRFPSDSNTRLRVESATASAGNLTLRLARLPIVPDLLAVVPAQSWLLLEVPRAAVEARPELSVWVGGTRLEGSVEYLGGSSR
jgi:hypothetical protein